MILQTLRLIAFILLVAGLGSLGQAQQTVASSSSPPKSTSSSTSNQEAVCDGALEIIPRGQMSFARKRYVAASPKSKSLGPKARAKSRK